MAKLSHVTGVVKLQFRVGTDGAVKDVKVISGPRLLRKAATDAASQWRYRPAMINGKPTEVVTEAAINFTLDDQ